MAVVCSYLMFKVAERKEEGEGEAYSMGSSLQVLFFFMIVASFIVMGATAFESRKDCDYLLVNETIITSNITSYDYTYFCTERNTSGTKWVYLLPLYLAILSGAFIIIYFLLLLYRIINYRGGSR